MRIKRFVAPDMRAALKMVRDEHGPDAVILSNRPVHGGIEVVAATDYDEALVQQALRTAAEADAMIAVPRAPLMAPASPPPAQTRLVDDVLTPRTLSRADEMIAAFAGSSAQARTQRTALAERARSPAAVDAKPATTRPAIASLLRKPAATPTAHDEAASNRSDDFRALLARLNASEEPASLFAPKQTPTLANLDDATAYAPTADADFAQAVSTTTRFDDVLAAANAETAFDAANANDAPGFSDAFETPFEASVPNPVMTTRIEVGSNEASVAHEAHALNTVAAIDSAYANVLACANVIDPAETIVMATTATVTADLDAKPQPSPTNAADAITANGTPDTTANPSTLPAPDFAELTAPHAAAAAAATRTQTSIDTFDALAEMAAVQAPPPAVAVAPSLLVTPPKLQIVTAYEDPGIVAMRNELASMRSMIERQMGQFGLERLRGSPARAFAFETLQAYGCDDALAQQIASRIDPALEPARVKAPLLAELARMLTISRAEPLQDGGVFALIGPTGAGKTTTIAKLAARYAQSHRARDVALVTTDIERPGAREQLHALGRKLGVTVCEAQGPEGLTDALDQLADYPLVLVDTAGYAARDRALLGQVTWLRATRRLRSLLVLPANLQPQDLSEAVRRYRIAAPEAVVLTKLDETGRLGSALSVAIKHGLTLAYTSAGQQVPADLEAADASRLVLQLERLRRASENPLATEERHVIA